MVNRNPTLGHSLFHMPETRWICDVPANATRNHIRRIVQALQDLRYGGVKQILSAFYQAGRSACRRFLNDFRK